MDKRTILIETIFSNNEYKEIFESEISKIMAIPKMPHCEFMHIGATSIGETYGEKIVDILVVVDNLHEITTFDEKRLNNIFYHRIGHDKLKGVIKYAKFSNYFSLSYNVLLYVVQRNTLIHKQFLKIQNKLLNELTLREQYDSFKKKYLGKPVIYTDYISEKQKFILNILEKEDIDG